MAERYNVIAVRIADGTERTLAQDKSVIDAEAIVKMAVIRRGVNEEFYVIRKASEAANG